MNTYKLNSGRLWMVVMLALMIFGQARVVSAQQDGNGAQQQTGCQRVARVDPRDYYPIGGASVPNARNAMWEEVCFAQGKSAGHLLNIIDPRRRTECSFEVRMDARDYYPIEGTGVPNARSAVLQQVCAQ